MAETQKPTVGRIVHFFTKNTAHHYNGMGEGPYAAMIVQPHGDRCASLQVFPPFAHDYQVGSVPLDDSPDASGDCVNRWRWPDRA